uniref:Secreted protein n=1 Tax=Streptomyces sp. NBC_00049 TaxID=2903617 RepID=A0AAU2JR09_9ACTN
MDKKNALRAGAVTAGTTLMMLLMTSPALALTPDDGDDPGPGLSIGETLGLYVALPIVLFLIIAGLVMVGDKSHKEQKQA